MSRRETIAAIFLCLILLMGCASSGNGGGGVKNYLKNVGTATPLDVNQKTNRILQKYQYRVVRSQEDEYQMYFETDWRYRTPFEDELETGVVDARTRLTVTGKPRSRTGVAGADLYVVRVMAENEARYEGSQQWMRVPMSNMLVEYLDKISDDLKLELLQGIRQY